MAYRRYTDEDRIKALELLALGHSLSDVSRTFNIPITTIHNWEKEKTDGARELKKELNSEELERIRKQKKEEFVAEAWDIIGIASKRLKRQLLDENERISARDLAIIKATEYDKQALAIGDATQNISGKLTLENLLDKVKGEEY